MGANASTSAGGTYLLFQLDEQSYGIAVDAVEEILPAAELAQVPGSPAFLLGFLNLSGEYLPAISLRALLRRPDRCRELYTPWLVLKTEPRLAIEVDAVREIRPITDDQAVILSQNFATNDLAFAAARLDGESLLLLSPEHLLLREERQRLAELAQLIRHRIDALQTTNESNDS